MDKAIQNGLFSNLLFLCQSVQQPPPLTLEPSYPIKLDVIHADHIRYPEKVCFTKFFALNQCENSKKEVELVLAMGEILPELMLESGRKFLC